MNVRKLRLQMIMSDKQERTADAYALAREHLQVAAVAAV